MVFKLLEAQRAMAALGANPDDTEQAIRAITAMSGGSQNRCLRRLKGLPTGAQLLRSRPELYDRLSNMDYLGSLPEGTLGKEIWHFYTTEELSAQGLKAASEAAGEVNRISSPNSGNTRISEIDWLGRRLRDLHDVFHVLTGYGRDMRGEIACLAFTFAQTWNTGVGYVVLRAMRNNGWNSEMGVLIRQAFRRGRRSSWLVDKNWEVLLEQPLNELRDRLRIGPQPVYEPLRSPGAPVLK
ncbi:MAG: Coq4 family protein [Pseudomonadales bacterium]|nr:hypothetical protein [Pseudomonadales bacterium]